MIHGGVEETHVTINTQVERQGEGEGEEGPEELKGVVRNIIDKFLEGDENFDAPSASASASFNQFE